MDNAKPAVGSRATLRIVRVEATTFENGAIAQIKSPSGRTEVKIEMTGDGASDLFVARDGIVQYKLPLSQPEPRPAGPFTTETGAEA